MPTSTTTTIARSTQNSIRPQQLKYIFPSTVINKITWDRIRGYKNRPTPVSWLGIIEGD